MREDNNNALVYNVSFINRVMSPKLLILYQTPGTVGKSYVVRFEQRRIRFDKGVDLKKEQINDLRMSSISSRSIERDEGCCGRDDGARPQHLLLGDAVLVVLGKMSCGKSERRKGNRCETASCALRESCREELISSPLKKRNRSGYRMRKYRK